jgi:integrase
MKQRPDGLYQSSIVIGHENGKPIKKYVYGKNPKEVTKKITKIRVELEKGVNIAKQGDTFRIWAEKWESIKYDDIGYNTVNMYKASLKSILPIIGDTKISELKLFDLQKLINDKFKQGAAKQTLRVIRMTISQILQMAVKNDVIHKNICEDLTIPSNAITNTKIILTDKQVATLNELEYEAKAFVLTMLYTGIRRGEALALTSKDINFDTNIITINKAIAFKGNSSILKYPKTKSGVRTIPIPDMLLKVLQGSTKADEQEPIFYTPKGTTITQDQYKQLWKRFIEETGINITAHQLRHTYATFLYNSDIDAKQAQELLGHSDIKTTLEIYTHLQEKNKTDALNKLNKFLKGEKDVDKP